MIHKQIRNGFTMIELLFVIVILGIVGTLSLDSIRQYYETIFRNQEVSNRVAEADHILDQISKYFENAISVSIVNLHIDPTDQSYCELPVAGDTNDYTVAFIGVDTDSLQGINGRPGWNEEVALLANNAISSTDSNYTAVNTIMTALGSTLANSALYDADSGNIEACDRFGMQGGSVGSPGFHRIAGITYPNTLVLNSENNATNGKRKYMLRSGYAFRVEDDGNFSMYTNFRPWAGQYFSAGQKVLLGKNVAHFYADYNTTDFDEQNVTDRGLVWRLKVCMRGIGTDLSMSDDQGLGICRERRVHVRY